MVLKSKFQIPEKREKIIAKPRLESFFEDTAVSFVIVKAMSGFGKTTVFAEAAEKYRALVRWYAMDVTDNESGSFISCMESIWETVDGQKCMEGMDGNIQSRLQALASRAQKWQRRIHIVLDNLQVISCEEIIGLILFLRQHAEEKLSFVLLTSGKVPKGFIPLLLKGEGVLLSEKELRLTPDEVWQYIGNHNIYSKETVSRVTEDLCGWPLGVRYVLRYLYMERDLHGGKGKIQMNCEGCPDWNRILQESLLSGCLDEVLWERCPKDLQAFLRQTAVLDGFSWEMCREVLAGQFTRQTFETAISCHGILESTMDGMDAYRYGGAFGTYLACKASDEEKDRIYRRAARWYQEKKDFMRLAAYAVLGRQDYYLVMIIEQYGRELLCEKNQTALGAIVEYLEKNAVLLLPEASGIVAQYFYSRGNFNKMEGYLNAADSSFGKENKYGCYRSLYRGLLRLEENQEKYEKQVHNALFFLKEADAGLPYLKAKEEEKLKKLMGRESSHRSLKVRTFGAFQVVALKDGRELAWRTRKGRELFAYLLDIEGRAVERRQLLGQLWPDEIPENAVAMLHNMIYNIRKELSAYRLETMLIYENKRYRINMDEIACDFPNIGQIAEMVERKNIEGLKKEHKIFLRYWGSYLEDIDSFWAEEKRTYYDEIYKKGCWILAGQFVKENNYETALVLYKNILCLDPYSEKAVEKMLLLYGEQKNWEQIKRCYRNFEETLEKDLGILPGKEVLAAYHRYF